MAVSLKGRWEAREEQEQGWGTQRKGSMEEFYYAKTVS